MRGAAGRGQDKGNRLLKLTLSGGVVFGLVSDGVLNKVLREAQDLPLKSVPLVVCLLDVSEAGARACLRHQGMEGMVSLGNPTFEIVEGQSGATKTAP